MAWLLIAFHLPLALLRNPSSKGPLVIPPPRIDVIVTSNSIPSHPSMYVISSCVAALAKHVRLPNGTRTLLMHDGVPPSASAKRVAHFAEYRRRVERWLAPSATAAAPPLTLEAAFLPNHRNLSGTVRAALERVRGPWVLLCQHDLHFARAFDALAVAADMAWSEHTMNAMRHVRFNMWGNTPRGDDAGPLYGKVLRAPMYRYTRSNGWSDQNHLTKLGYYEQVVWPTIAAAARQGYRRCRDMHGKYHGNRARFMEDCMNPIVHEANEAEHSQKWGTWLMGAPGAEAYVSHLNARKTALRGSAKLGGKLRWGQRVDRQPYNQEFLFKD